MAPPPEDEEEDAKEPREVEAPRAAISDTTLVRTAGLNVHLESWGSCGVRGVGGGVGWGWVRGGGGSGRGLGRVGGLGEVYGANL